MKQRSKSLAECKLLFSEFYAFCGRCYEVDELKPHKLQVPNLLGDSFFSTALSAIFCPCHTRCCPTVGKLFIDCENAILKCQ